jgi:hypothetical protein
MNDIDLLAKVSDIIEAKLAAGDTRSLDALATEAKAEVYAPKMRPVPECVACQMSGGQEPCHNHR